MKIENWDRKWRLMKWKWMIDGMKMKIDKEKELHKRTKDTKDDKEKIEKIGVKC